jgi:hypothetical protein
MGSVSAFSHETREAVRERTGDRCDICGYVVTVGHFHHRKPRRMGGSTDPALGSPANCLLLHPSCHERAERDRLKSLEYGWLLRDRDDPASTPVLIRARWMWLGADGTAQPLGGEDLHRPGQVSPVVAAGSGQAVEVGVPDRPEGDVAGFAPDG